MKKFFYPFVWREKVCITLHKKPYFLFPSVLRRWSFKKNLTGIWSFLYYQERGFIFPKNMILFFRHKRKDDLSQKIPGNIMFSSNVIFFVISGKMVFIKKHMGKWYFLYIWVDVTGVTLPSWQKSKDTIAPEKYTQGWHLRHHRKKMIFILENVVFLLKYHIYWHPRKGSRSSQRGCSTRKGVLKNFAKLTEKDLCQSLIFYKVTGLGVQLY